MALVTQLAEAFPGRAVHVVADAAYHGPALKQLPASVTWTTRLPANAVLYSLAPPRLPGERGRPCLKGLRLGTPAELAAAATWTPVTVRIYGRSHRTDWPPAPACGTAACTPAPSGSSSPVTTPASWPWSPPTWPPPPPG